MDVAWYGSRDVASTLILVGAVLVALIFLGNAIPPGPARWLVWATFFAVVGALAPAPWVVPPAAFVFFWLSVALPASPEGGCPATQICDPVPGRPELPLLVSLLVLVSTVAGSSLRYLYDWQKALRSASATEDLPP